MFSLSSDLENFRTKIRTLARERIAPVASEIDRTAEYPKAIHQLLVQEGCLRVVCTPESGPNRFLARAILIEEIAYASAAVSMIPMVNELGCTPIQLFGTSSQKARTLEDVANGTLFASYGLTEPQAGSDVAALECKAEKAGKDWIVTGEKSWICNVRQPGFCVVFARTGAKGARDALTALIVPTDAKGFEVVSVEPTLGLRGSPTYNFRLNGVRVPADAILGNPGDGYSKNHPVERFFRDAKVTQIYEGTNQIQRMVIARKLATATSAEL